MAPAAVEVPPISGLTLRLFRRVVRRYFRRHFRAVQMLHSERLRSSGAPLIVYGNHSSWWDPMVVLLLGDLLLPERRHYAPIEAHALEKYPILRKLGLFPVELSSPRGAAQFLRTASAILRSNGVLWLTPQGRFADTRQFPLAFKPGLAALARHMPDVPLLPLAVEYTFWDERLPETLIAAGDPFFASTEASNPERTRELEDALANVMLELQQAAVARDPGPFHTLLSGARGTGGIYGMFRRSRAALHGERPELDHTHRN